MAKARARGKIKATTIRLNCLPLEQLHTGCPIDRAAALGWLADELPAWIDLLMAGLESPRADVRGAVGLVALDVQTLAEELAGALVEGCAVRITYRTQPGDFDFAPFTGTLALAALARRKGCEGSRADRARELLLVAVAERLQAEGLAREIAA